MQQQVDVNASHLEKERHQLAEQIKKVVLEIYTILAKNCLI